MKLYYEEGPLFMGCGAAGQFKIGVPKEVPDDLAEDLLRKGRLKKYVEPQTENAETLSGSPQRSEHVPGMNGTKKGKEE